jgi:hypothetical protein
MKHCTKTTATLCIVILAALGGLAAQAGEKKQLVGKNKPLYYLSQSTSLVGDVPGHEIQQAVLVLANSANDPDWTDMQATHFLQFDQTNGSGSHRGYGENLHQGGDKNYFRFEGTHKTLAKGNGSWETTTEGIYTLHGGTGKFKNMKGKGTYKCKQTPEDGGCDWQGEHEY